MSERPRYFILDKHGEPVPVATVIEWATWFEREKRQVGLTHFGPLVVSTVFLGLDHGWGDGPPVIWETMIFANGARNRRRLDEEQDRCSGDRAQAVTMHEQMVARVAAYLADNDPARDYAVMAFAWLMARFEFWQLRRALRRRKA